MLPDIAASAYGREYLSSSSCGLDLVDVLCSVLVEIPHGQGYGGVGSSTMYICVPYLAPPLMFQYFAISAYVARTKLRK